MRLRCPLVFLALCLLSIGVSRAAVLQAFLVQNSGWMEPFYADPQSQFRELVGAVIGAAVQPGEHVFVSAFNQSTPHNPSPRLVYDGAAGAAATAAVASIELAQKASGGKYADTDFQEAVRGVIENQFKAHPGIIWIITNNKNSPNNSPDTAARNREFYGILHDEPAIVRTLAFPLKMPVRGHYFAAGGLMIYALAYGREASDVLQERVLGQHFRSVITEAPARLKPLDREVARLVLGSVHDSGGVAAGMGTDKRTIVVSVDYAAARPLLDLTAVIENTSFPYEIVSADVAAEARTAGWRSQLEFRPARITNLLPGAPGSLSVRLPLPSGNIPSLWSFSALSLLGKTYLIPGVIQLQLTNQKLRIAPDFTERLAGIFPGDPLPESFVPPDHARDSGSEIPFVVRISYPLYPLFLLVLVALLLVGASLVALSLVNSRMRYEVRVDNEAARKIYLKAFQSLPVRTAGGEPAGMLSRSLGKGVSVKSADGHQVSVLRQIR